ncbi:hypothetical protein JOS77_15995 [Chromobacterium haemolyticum]|nr:hypothetical protein JOS77_15995 [Chromobacterium haemolyticum]
MKAELASGFESDVGAHRGHARHAGGFFSYAAQRFFAGRGAIQGDFACFHTGLDIGANLSRDFGDGFLNRLVQTGGCAWRSFGDKSFSSAGVAFGRGSALGLLGRGAGVAFGCGGALGLLGRGAGVAFGCGGALGLLGRGAGVAFGCGSALGLLGRGALASPLAAVAR